MILNGIIFYIAWGITLYAAGTAYSFAGAAMNILIAAAYLYFSFHKKAESLLLLLLFITGMILDSSYIYFGVMTFVSGYTDYPLSPLWVSSLWVLFGTTIYRSLSWMQERLLLACLCGATGGPISYWGAARMGAVEILWDPVMSTGLMAVIWAILFPLIMLTAKCLNKSDTSCLKSKY